MARGIALHEIQERVTRLMVEQDETTVPWELAKAIGEEVLAELHVPVEEHDAIREMAYRWGSEFEIRGTVIACETLFVVDVPVPCLPCGGSGEILPLPGTNGGRLSCPDCAGAGVRSWEVRCRIDFAEVSEDGSAVRVEDVKSSKAAVPWEEISRKRSDGSLHGKSFQLLLYAIALAYGTPIEEIDGEERRMDVAPPGTRAQTFDLSFVYPAIEDREGKMVRRDVTLTRLEVETYRASLTGLVTRLAQAEHIRQWPALVSDAACGECPASALCPIPAELRDHRGTINTPEECAEALEVRFREKKDQSARTKEIRAFVKARGPVLFGDGMVAEIGYSESVRVNDREAFNEAMDRALEFGEPFDRAEYEKRVESFPLVERALTADEKLGQLTDGGSYERDDRPGGDDIGGVGGEGAGFPASARDFDPSPGGPGRADKPF